MNPQARRFVQIADALREPNAWTNNEWLCRPDIVAAKDLLLVRANMAPGYCHPFHYHPHREEIIYVIYGRAEQWVGDDYRILTAGEMAHIPPGTIHATYNPHAEPLVFLAGLQVRRDTDAGQFSMDRSSHVRDHRAGKLLADAKNLGVAAHKLARSLSEPPRTNQAQPARPAPGSGRESPPRIRKPARSPPARGNPPVSTAG